MPESVVAIVASSSSLGSVIVSAPPARAESASNCPVAAPGKIAPNPRPYPACCGTAPSLVLPRGSRRHLVGVSWPAAPFDPLLDGKNSGIRAFSEGAENVCGEFLGLQ